VWGCGGEVDAVEWVCWSGTRRNDQGQDFIDVGATDEGNLVAVAGRGCTVVRRLLTREELLVREVFFSSGQASFLRLGFRLLLAIARAHNVIPYSATRTDQSEW
jgi:hypothetical protein